MLVLVVVRGRRGGAWCSRRGSPGCTTRLGCVAWVVARRGRGGGDSGGVVCKVGAFRVGLGDRLVANGSGGASLAPRRPLPWQERALPWPFVGVPSALAALLGSPSFLQVVCCAACSCTRCTWGSRCGGPGCASRPGSVAWVVASCGRGVVSHAWRPVGGACWRCLLEVLAGAVC